MPPPEEMYLEQRAILWEWQEVDDHNEVIVGRPVELWVRWNNTQSDMLTPEGNKIAVDAKVTTPREIPVGSIMWEGGFGDISGTGTGTDQVPETGLMQVKVAQESMDLRGQVCRYEYGLVFFRHTMPVIQ